MHSILPDPIDHPTILYFNTCRIVIMISVEAPYKCSLLEVDFVLLPQHTAITDELLNLTIEHLY